MVNAVAVLNGTGNANGQVNFSQEANGPTKTDVDLSDFNSDGDYELVVHVFGDISNQWHSTGHSFKDLVTINIKDGKGQLKHDFHQITLSGPNSIIGKGFVVHAGGSAGSGVVWGVIGLAQ